MVACDKSLPIVEVLDVDVSVGGSLALAPQQKAVLGRVIWIWDPESEGGGAGLGKGVRGAGGQGAEGKGHM